MVYQQTHSLDTPAVAAAAAAAAVAAAAAAVVEAAKAEGTTWQQR